MGKIERLLEKAARYACLGNGRRDKRGYWYGVVAERDDGTLVFARNGASALKNPTCHAEYRVLRKAGARSTVYVARVSREDGSLKNAKPCPYCEAALRHKYVKRVYYTVSDEEYAVMNLL